MAAEAPAILRKKATLQRGRDGASVDLSALGKLTVVSNGSSQKENRKTLFTACSCPALGGVGGNRDVLVPGAVKEVLVGKGAQPLVLAEFTPLAPLQVDSAVTRPDKPMEINAASNGCSAPCSQTCTCYGGCGSMSGGCCRG